MGEEGGGRRTCGSNGRLHLMAGQASEASAPSLTATRVCCCMHDRQKKWPQPGSFMHCTPVIKG
jgi:hypothetical protein